MKIKRLWDLQFVQRNLCENIWARPQIVFPMKFLKRLLEHQHYLRMRLFMLLRKECGHGNLRNNYWSFMGDYVTPGDDSICSSLQRPELARPITCRNNFYCRRSNIRGRKCIRSNFRLYFTGRVGRRRWSLATLKNIQKNLEKLS